MNVACVLCNGEIETIDDDVVVTVSWVFQEIIQKNNLQLDQPLPRVVKICKKCWDSIENKPDSNDYYWLFNKSL